MRAAVLGCGVIGASWIDAFLAGGNEVAVWDPAARTLDELARKHNGRIVVADKPSSAVAGADFVQESGPESLGEKRKLMFGIAEAVGARTIVASSTSTLQPSDIQQGLPFAAQFLIGHPFNPPHIIPLIEVLGGKETEEWAVDHAMTFYRALGKHPIHLKRERPGHLANRLQAALWREAVDAVACGQASVDDVDAAVRLALGPRWALMGPFATFNLGGGQGGLTHFLDHLGVPFETLWDDAHRPIVTEDLKRQLIDEVQRSSDGRTPEALAAERDIRLRSILAVVRQPLSDL